jgi:quinol monooxygenase YgiN
MEQWAAIEAHKTSSHFNEFFKATQGYLMEPLDIQVIPVSDSIL